MKSVFGSRTALVIVSAVAGAALVSGITIAMASGSSSVIYACKNKSSGALRVVAEGVACKATESPLSWNQQGPTGPTGAAGPAGAGAYEMQYQLNTASSCGSLDYTPCATPPLPFVGAVTLDPANYP